MQPLGGPTEMQFLGDSAEPAGLLRGRAHLMGTDQRVLDGDLGS